MSGSKNFASFPKRFIHRGRPPGLRLALDPIKRMEDLAVLCAKEVKSVAAEEREEYFSAVSIEVKNPSQQAL